MKTKLGISVGLLGAAAYFMGLFGGYMAMLVIAGYILIFESNEWLRRTAVKAVAVCIFFSVLSVCVGFVPDIMELINGVLGIFKTSLRIDILSKLISLILDAINFVEKLLLLTMGLRALRQGNVKLSSVDKLISEHMKMN